MSLEELLVQHNELINKITAEVPKELTTFTNTFFTKYPYISSVQINIHDSGYNDGESSYTVIEEPTFTINSIEMLCEVSIDSMVAESDYNMYVEYLSSKEKLKASRYSQEELEELVSTYKAQKELMSKEDIAGISESLSYLNNIFKRLPEKVIENNYLNYTIMFTKEGYDLEHYEEY